MSTRIHCAALLVLSMAFVRAAGQPPLQEKVMLTEVCPYGRQAVEIFNFGAAPADLAQHRVRFRFGVSPTSYGSTVTSAPLGLTLLPGQIAVIQDPSGGPDLEIPGWVPRADVLPSFSIPSGTSVTVGLLDAASAIVDEVRLLGTASGSYSPVTVGGAFRGQAQTGTSASGTPSAERVWGLDSDSGYDWCSAAAHSMGRMNTGSGPRGSDPTPVESVVISEIEPRPGSIFLANDTIELHVRSTASVDLHNWFLLVSGGQGLPFTRLAPWTGTTLVPAGGYVVLYDNGALSPFVSMPELPAGTPIFSVPNIPIGRDEFTVALYDDLGRLVDLVRTTGDDDQVIHNHPRPPGAWNDFLGVARRSPTVRGIARASTTGQIRNGSDWRPTYRRTLGAANGPFTDLGGEAFAPDVRLDEGLSPGQGLFYMVNGGTALAGSRVDLLVSTGHSQGLGPIAGLGVDCLQYYMMFNLAGTAPVVANLDAGGSFRFLFPPSSFPPGMVLDAIAVVSNLSLPGGAAMSKVLEYDT